MFICSPIAITLDSTTILAEGDWLVELPEMGFTVEGEDYDFIDADYMEPQGRGNQLNQLAFTRVIEHASVEDAIIAVMDFEVDTPKAGVLVIGGRTYPKARMPYGTVKISDVNAAWTIERYALIYGGAEA